jgi:hypothetical protein
MNKGIIVWKGDLGSPPNNFAKTTIEGVTDDIALATLAAALLNHSDCVVARRSFNSVTGVPGGSPGVSANVDNKCTVYMQDPATLHTVSLEIPAVKAASMEIVDNAEFERMTAAALAAIVSAVNTATGKSLIGLYGKANKK